MLGQGTFDGPGSHNPGPLEFAGVLDNLDSSDAKEKTLALASLEDDAMAIEISTDVPERVLRCTAIVIRRTFRPQFGKT